jgi:hypothetical protein
MSDIRHVPGLLGPSTQSFMAIFSFISFRAHQNPLIANLGCGALAWTNIYTSRFFLLNLIPPFMIGVFLVAYFVQISNARKAREGQEVHVSHIVADTKVLAVWLSRMFLLLAIMYAPTTNVILQASEPNLQLACLLIPHSNRLYLYNPYAIACRHLCGADKNQATQEVSPSFASQFR